MANGFKITNIVLYPEFAQLNVEMQKEEGSTFAGNANSTINLPLEAAEGIRPGKVYEISFKEVKEQAPAKPLEIPKF
jgi:hypothetical protein